MRLSTTSSLAALAILILAVPGCATQEMWDEQKLDWVVEDFKAFMIVEDDSLEPTVVFSTRDGFKERYGLTGAVRNDSFLRGFLHKETGGRVYQCYTIFYSSEDNWPYPYQANYGRPLRISEISDIHSDVNCAGSRMYGSCDYEQHVAFDIDHDEIMRAYDTGAPTGAGESLWRFRIKNKGTSDYDGELLTSEIVALVDAMNEYKFIPTQ